jgi:hypothetical protein
MAGFSTRSQGLRLISSRRTTYPLPFGSM